MKKTRGGKNPGEVWLNHKFTIVFLSALLLAMLATFMILVLKRSTERVESEYEGRVVDRWADYAESTQGSRPRFRLLVESDDGKRITVRVEPQIYEAAKVGMRIRKKSGEAAIIESEQKTRGGK